MNTIRLLLSLLEGRDRRHLVYLVGAGIVTAALSVASIAALGPLMRLLADPDGVHHGYVAMVYSALHFTDARSFLIAFGAVAFLLVLGSNLAKIATVHAVNRFAGTQRYRLSSRLFARYLQQPWAFHIQRNSSHLSQGLLQGVDTVVNHVLRPAMDAVTQGVMALGIVLFLVLTSPLVALAAAVVLGGAYAIIYLLVRPRLARLGHTHWHTNEARFTTTAEAFSVMKELKVLHLEERYSAGYQDSARRHARAETWLQTVAVIPRYMLEATAFGLMIALVLVLLAVEGTMSAVVPLLAVYAFAGYRLLPALQVVYSSVTQARYFAHTVEQLYRDLHQLSREPSVPSHPAPLSASTLEPFQSLTLSEVSFRYSDSEADILRDITLEIRRNELVALVGTTGCGKTTLVDIMTGLLHPTSGTVKSIGGPVRFGYVPQDIRIVDTTVAGNIALGIPAAEIDHPRVHQAAEIASLDQFVMNELPQGYQTVVGEHGVRLSGGQRQRLGIARALYNDPEVLVLDEATAALDTVTEAAVMNAVTALHHRKTIILIAHRLTTVERCDRIYLLDHGCITATGTYTQLLTDSAPFRTFAGSDPAPPQ